MKRLTAKEEIIGFFIVLLSCSPFLFAQKAQIKTGYNYHYFDPRGIEKNHDFILLAGQNCSKFYNSHSQWLDSIRCTKDGEQWHNQQALIMIGELMNKSREENLTFLKPIITDATYFIGRPLLFIIRLAISRLLLTFVCNTEP
ncbi:hypothetical protein [uncultured Bacteroides sp.]|uniref:hypothetical protein n=1 Tax=uncultured Bacteroides sp. TaxID=162156 RepID=UPI0023D6C011|nr:hypothetical protein [uncultured Bacteroides sp.]MDE5759944.1 hypothetical protein [Bacteroides sp.]